MGSASCSTSLSPCLLLVRSALVRIGLGMFALGASQLTSEKTFGAISAVDVREVSVAFAKKNGKQDHRDYDIETYVSGVILGELPRDWPTEALKAQAVVARTFAISRIQSGADRLRASVLDQMFLDPDSSQISREQRARALAAAQATAGEVLGHPDLQGRIIPTHYHADCGGETEEPKLIWGRGPELGVAKDEGCPVAKSSKWRVFFSWQSIEARLSVGNSSGHEAGDFQILKRTQSGRVASVEIKLQHGNVLTMSGEQLRAKLGYGLIKSTLFEVESQNGDGVWLSGRGFGHGAGLCQWGARRMALKGISYREILRHYYPKLRLQAPSRSLAKASDL